MLLTILVILLILALIGGGFGYERYGAWSASPVVVIFIVLLLLWAFGILR